MIESNSILLSLSKLNIPPITYLKWQTPWRLLTYLCEFVKDNVFKKCYYLREQKCDFEEVWVQFYVFVLTCGMRRNLNLVKSEKQVVWPY